MNHRHNEILGTISEFLVHFEKEILLLPISKLMVDMQELDPNCFDRGGLELWASALSYAVAKENCMHYSDTENPVTLDRVADYYGVKKNSLGTKASKIFNEMGMSQFSRRYGLGMGSIFEKEEEEEVEILSLIAIIELSRPRGEIDKIWEKFVDEFYEDELDYYEIIGEEYEENILNLIFEVHDFFANEFIDRLSFIGTVLEVFEDVSNKNDFVPPPHYETFMRLYNAINIEDKKFDDIDDLNEFMQQFARVPIDEFAEHINQNPVDHAEIQALDAYALSKEESLIKLKSILNDFPNTVEAYICQAGWEQDPETQLDILYLAIEAGEEKLDVEDINKEKMWWSYHLTRPYMRALNLLAVQLFRLDYIDETIEIIEDLLEKNPNDNQGIRYFAIQVFVEKSKWLKLKKLFQDFPDEVNIEFDLGKLFYHYFKSKSKAPAKRYLEKILLKSPNLQSLCANEPITEVQDDDEFVTSILDQFMAKDSKFAKWFSMTLYDIYEKKIVNNEDREAKIIPFDFGNLN